jgi:hypothetical protein
MEYVVVERSFPTPVIFEDIQAIENAHQWCLDLYEIKFLRSYFSSDCKRMVCLYQAPDAEAVRRASAQAKMPYDRIYVASVHERPPEPPA